MFQIKYSSKTNHIAGITERTKASGDGLTYAQSACGTLTGNYRLSAGREFANLRDALDAAKDDVTRKVCGKCAKAAELELAATETPPAPAKAEPIPTGETPIHVNGKVYFAEPLLPGHVRDVTYRGSRNGKPFGPMRFGGRSDKPGSVGRTVFDAMTAPSMPKPAAPVATLTLNDVQPAALALALDMVNGDLNRLRALDRNTVLIAN